MKNIDPGHIYELNHVDAPGKEIVTFIKRSSRFIIHDNEHDGTNVQEVLRMLINRTQYLDGLITCEESNDAVYYLRMALFVYEARALRRKRQHHNRQDGIHEADDDRYEDIPFTEYRIEDLETGPDGHILVKEE